MKNCREFLRCKKCPEPDKFECELINKNRQKLEQNRVITEQTRAHSEQNKDLNILGRPKIKSISGRDRTREIDYER